MGEPKFDYTFERGFDLNGVSHDVKDSEGVDEICPVCGDSCICCDDLGDMFFDKISRSYYCESCGSEFTYTYRVTSVRVHKMGHIEDEDEEDE